ncbi:uncharacterized protein LOC128361258 [Scomber japonicus]|uniref:uncharacterized protein LOC128361258 n=1 Tax=Scomber japonicus TaxID=13676 RepID=UPI00230577DD|nr:uncharacterized protein LOC128361258 [Scomber japonicus]
MNDWTEREWPYEGSFEKEKLQMAEMNVNTNMGNPSWNFAYMRECMRVWITVARQRYGVHVDEKRPEKCSAELKAVIEKIAARVETHHIRMLKAALQTRATELTNIKQRHGDNLRACATAMTHNWAKRQAKVPSPQELLTVLEDVEFVRPELQKSKHSVSNYPKLTKTNPARHSNTDEQASLRPCNTPILPIPKPNRPDEWRFVQDLQAINNIVVPTAPIVPDTNSILASLPSNSTHYTVIDLCSAFFSIPLHLDSQYLFAFTFKGKQYTWRRLPQGYVESPTVYAAAVKRDLDDLHFRGGSTLLQYADDLLIASPSEEACRTDSILLLQRLAECGHRASLPKLQFCRSEVTYLGHLLKDGQRLLSPERVKLLVNMPPPRTKKGMLSFLGMANYCRHWIFEYAAMDSVLRAATLQSAPTAVQWTDDMQKAFQNLKHALTMAPALGLPDYHQPFHLHVHEREGFATGILVQKHGSHYRPVAYYSSRLTPVVLGMPGCLRAVAAVAILLDKSAPIVLAHDCVVHVPHAVLHILNTSATQHMTAARRSGYEATILSSPHITLKRSPPLNPATLLPLIDTTEIEHDCIATIDMCTSPRPDLLQTPIPNSEMILYTDGSASRPSDNVHLAGYAVVNDWEVLEARALPPGTSAQAPELYALTRACIIASGKTATIYTDSRYAFGVAHDFGQLWKMRGFVSSSGRPLRHHALVNDLLDAIMRPFQLAIVKCAAHSQENDPVSRGNAMADFAAKQAATSSSSMVERTVPGAADNQDSFKG